MSELPLSSPYRSAPGEPVDDERRASLGRRLNEAYAAGSLDDVDYRARLDTLYAARTLGELVPVVTGLPAAPDPTPALVEQTGRPGELAPARTADPRRTLILVAAIAAAVVVVLAVLAAGLLT